MKSPERVIIIATHSPEIWAQVDEVIALTDFDNDEFAKEFQLLRKVRNSDGLNTKILILAKLIRSVVYFLSY